jgi:bifunctional N-acetylglucosamine-1-phosphate-uridyltransferase/glucosamine-1-phosphate-acetyltransferase GlmU-like protein
MGLNSTLKNKISIGSRVIVSCGAAVINDVSDEDIAIPECCRSYQGRWRRAAHNNSHLLLILVIMAMLD